MTDPSQRNDPRPPAAERILEAAERLFTERGVAAIEMSHVAQEAGCSRATLYRYFDSGHALQVAYMHRRAHEVAETVRSRVQGIDDPHERLTQAMLAALHEVRRTPALAAWFSQPDSGLTAELAGSSPVVQSVCAATLGDPADPDNQERAQWLVRVIISLLVTPAGDGDAELRMIQRFVTPVLLDQGRSSVVGEVRRGVHSRP